MRKTAFAVLTLLLILILANLSYAEGPYAEQSSPFSFISRLFNAIGKYIYIPDPINCGDAICGTGENYNNCPGDCEPPCGILDRSCCAGNTCNSGLQCCGGVCKTTCPVICGALDQACCSGSACNNGLTCCNSTCRLNCGNTCTGECKQSPCSTFNQCSAASGSCITGHCCTGACNYAGCPQGLVFSHCICGTETCIKDTYCCDNKCQSTPCVISNCGASGQNCCSDYTCKAGLTCCIDNKCKSDCYSDEDDEDEDNDDDNNDNEKCPTYAPPAAGFVTACLASRGVVEILNHTSYKPPIDVTVGAWNFDEYNGTIIYDSSGLDNNGVIADNNHSNPDSNTPPIRSGSTEKSLIFDGIDDYAQIADSASLKSVQFTWRVWVRPLPSSYTPPGPRRIISKYVTGTPGFEIHYDQNTKLVGFDWGNGTSWTKQVIATTPLSESALTLVIASYDGTTMKLYLNGQLQNSLEAHGLSIASNAPLMIGNSWNYARPFSGYIDNFVMYNRALTDEEARLNYIGMTCMINYCTIINKACNCNNTYEPVCGANNHTYLNSCFALCAGTAVVSNGICSETPPIPPNPPNCNSAPTNADCICPTDYVKVRNYSPCLTGSCPTVIKWKCIPQNEIIDCDNLINRFNPNCNCEYPRVRINDSFAGIKYYRCRDRVFGCELRGTC